MDRRKFLQLLGISAVTVATPKLIFDVGKNLSRIQTIVMPPLPGARIVYVNGEAYHLVETPPKLIYDLNKSFLMPQSTISLLKPGDLVLTAGWIG